MRAFERVFIAALCARNTVTASPLDLKPDVMTNLALNPWVTIDASGMPSTITPAVTMIDGKETTINEAPTSLTQIATGTDDSSTTITTTGAAATATGGGSFELCRNQDGPFAPFCKPTNGSSMYVGQTYYITWDPAFYSTNASALIQLNYVNASDGGSQAYQSNETPVGWGFISLTVDKAWLQDKHSNNVTLFITTLNAGVDKQASSIGGPTVMITNKPATYPHQAPTKAPSGAALYIALPLVFVFVSLGLCGGMYYNRKHRLIGLGSIMGRRRGYGSGRSRRERMGLNSRKEADIRLQEVPENSYRDEPADQTLKVVVTHSRNISQNLGSLVGTPEEVEEPAGGNYFREEMKRQEEQRLHDDSHAGRSE